jgi:hypothetical protein
MARSNALQRSVLISILIGCACVDLLDNALHAISLCLTDFQSIGRTLVAIRVHTFFAGAQTSDIYSVNLLREFFLNFVLGLLCDIAQSRGIVISQARAANEERAEIEPMC